VTGRPDRHAATRILLGAATLVLVGAIAFGLWHVVVGGLINGNGAAARFGIALAAVAFFGLTGVRLLVRRA
jgi:hypothetical protein